MTHVSIFIYRKMSSNSGRGIVSKDDASAKSNFGEKNQIEFERDLGLRGEDRRRRGRRDGRV